MRFAVLVRSCEPGARYHAVAEEGGLARDVAETVGRGLGIPVRSLSPEEVPQYYGEFAHFATLDLPASSEWTRRKLGWTPTGPSLLADLEQMNYHMAAAQ